MLARPSLGLKGCVFACSYTCFTAKLALCFYNTQPERDSVDDPNAQPNPIRGDGCSFSRRFVSLATYILQLVAWQIVGSFA